ncbi:hypothetical protein JCM19275_1594 [Nonlabens ulvanivorans]|uniref:Uncharacterized protein n=1 Tax=Nonlabens ulvanivorans TaxID=906888 RepID=A0A090WFG2_NONUL|nr:hypothetical protein JCM19275_1594 [Nonlabens ulvanivorans]
MPYWVNEMLSENFKEEDWIALSVDKPKKSVINKEFLKANTQKFNFIREAPLNCDYEGDKLLNSLLEKYIGNDVIIPFNLKERKKKFPLAFMELKRYMEKYL